MDLMKLIFSIIGFFILVGTLFVGDYGIILVMLSILVLYIMSISDSIGTIKEPKVPSFMDAPPPPPQSYPQRITPPKQTIKPVFSCRYCDRVFEEELKLRRHIGKSHVDKLEI